MPSAHFPPRCRRYETVISRSYDSRSSFNKRYDLDVAAPPHAYLAAHRPVVGEGHPAPHPTGLGHDDLGQGVGDWWRGRVGLLSLRNPVPGTERLKGRVGTAGQWPSGRRCGGGGVGWGRGWLLRGLAPELLRTSLDT